MMNNNNNIKHLSSFGGKTFSSGKGTLFLAIYAMSSVCLEVLLLTTLLHTNWIGQSDDSSTVGQAGLYSYCLSRGGQRMACQGRLFGTSNPPVNLPVVLSVCAALHIVAVVAVAGTCMTLFCTFICGTPSRLMIVAGLGHFLAGVCLTVVCTAYPSSWAWEVVRLICGPAVSPYSLGGRGCTLRPAYIITVVCTLDTYLLAGLALLLSRRLAGIHGRRDLSASPQQHQLAVISAGGRGQHSRQTEMIERSTVPMISIYDDNFSLAKLEDHLI